MASRIECIRKACATGDEIFGLLLERFKTFKTEKDIDRFIRNEARKRGLKLAFPPIVAAAKNAAEIHHKPRKTRLKRGFLVLDFGVKVGGFCSDMTRTLHIGKASGKEKMRYRIVLAAQEKGLGMVKPGADCFEIDYNVRKKLGGLRELFAHSLGHGVGKKIHDKPTLSPKTSERLKLGQVVTVEPGIYAKGKYGIRVEDSVLVGKRREVLTKSAKRLIEIK